jgi:hypothetical protein
MANNVIQSPDVPARRGSFLNSAWGDLSGAVITVTSGAVAAWRSINKSFYQNIKINPSIKDEIDRSKLASQQLLETVKNEPNISKKRELLFPGLKKLSGEHEGEMTRILRDQYGVEGFFDKIGILRPHQKWEVGVIVGATMAVALGAVMTLAGMSKTSDKQRELEDRLNALENSKQR